MSKPNWSVHKADHYDWAILENVGQDSERLVARVGSEQDAERIVKAWAFLHEFANWADQQEITPSDLEETSGRIFVPMTSELLLSILRTVGR